MCSLLHGRSEYPASFAVQPREMLGPPILMPELLKEQRKQEVFHS